MWSPSNNSPIKAKRGFPNYIKPTNYINVFTALGSSLVDIPASINTSIEQGISISFPEEELYCIRILGQA
jgi:hypothetical protein